jgi:alkaline phosphatase
LIPHPSRISSITGLAIAPTLALAQRRHKAVLALTSAHTRRYIALVKWRNQMLALFCLFLFFAFGFFYFKYWVIQKPFGIILFIGEGLDAQQLAAARLHAGGAGKPLALETLRYAALLKNYSSDSATPDPAAAATALATGVKVNNGSLGIDVEGNELTTLIELARDNGRLVGLVTNGTVTSPTSAAFYAHTLANDDRSAIARQLLKGKLDLILGGGLADFDNEAENEHAGNGRDLIGDFTDAGYEIVHSLDELEEVPWWRRPKLAGFFSDAELPFVQDIGTQDDQPALAVMVRRAIELLQYHRGGYLLVVDAALMRKAAMENNAAQRVAETVEFDHAISEALRYAGAKSMILVCSDVAIPAAATRPEENARNTPSPETGDGIATPPAELPAGEARPSPDVPTVPNAAATVAEQPATPPPNETSPLATELIEQPKAGDATAEDVVAFGTGLGANALHGVAESTVVFDIIRDNL